MPESRSTIDAGGAARRGPDRVYPPREDSLLLLPFARGLAGRSVVELCAGSGIASLEAARGGAWVVATDRNPHALRALRDRASADGLEVRVVRADLANGLGRFDRVLANPPYLPTEPEERDPDPWHNLALDGGPDGSRVTARLVDSLSDHLAPAGSAFVVVSSLQASAGLAAIRERWASTGGHCTVAAEREFEGERLEVWRFSTGKSSDGL
jgi:release factor glutamine methyltransferase